MPLPKVAPASAPVVSPASVPAPRPYRRRLPHWRTLNAVYFVTFRVARDQPPLTHDERTLVMTVMKFHVRTRYLLPALVVMDDHLHAVVGPLESHRLESILHSWKSFSAHQMQRTTGRSCRVWQKESFDRIIRSEAELQQKVGYICRNPVKRWPDWLDYPWVRVEA